MGQKLGKSGFSCVDCGSRLITHEDLESSSKFNPRDIYYPDCTEGSNDEITVFESPLKPSIRHSQSTLLEKSLLFDSVQEVLTLPGTSSCDSGQLSLAQHRETTVRPARQSDTAMNEEYVATEMSAPGYRSSSSFFSSRCKTYSRNFSEGSLNLVDTVRKQSS
jgi:hypothetical protein